MAEIFNSPSAADNIGSITWEGGDSVIPVQHHRPTQCCEKTIDSTQSHLPIIEHGTLLCIGYRDG